MKNASCFKYGPEAQPCKTLTPRGGGGGTLGVSGWGCAAGTLKASTYTRGSSPYTKVNSPNPPYPRVAVFQKLLRSLAQSSQNKTLYHNP